MKANEVGDALRGDNANTLVVARSTASLAGDAASAQSSTYYKASLVDKDKGEDVLSLNDLDDLDILAVCKASKAASATNTPFNSYEASKANEVEVEDEQP